MKSIVKFLQLNFLPNSADAALLVLRMWLGGSLLLLHGRGKLTGFSSMAGKFPDPFGVGSATSLGLTVFGEVVCAALLAVGLITRFAALVLTIVMAVAFVTAHGMKLSGPGSGELAYIYLAGFVTLLIAGPGRFSADRKLGAAV